MKEKIDNIFIWLAVYFCWTIVFNEYFSYEYSGMDERAYLAQAIPFTIVTAYIWNHFTKK